MYIYIIYGDIYIYIDASPMTNGDFFQKTCLQKGELHHIQLLADSGWGKWRLTYPGENLLPRHAWCGSRGSKYLQHRKDLPTGCKRLEIQGIGRVSRTPVDLEKGGPTKKWLKNGIPQCTHETGHFVIIYTRILQQ